MLFLLNILWWSYGLGLTCLLDTVLAFLVSTYADTVTPEDANLFYSGRETLFPAPKFSCSYWSPKRMALPIFFFLLSLSQKTCFSYNRVGGHLRNPPRTISISNPPHQQWINIQGQNSGSSVYVIHKVSSLLPSSASSINWGQRSLTLVGELETSSPQICLLPKAILVSFPGKCSEIGLL